MERPFGLLTLTIVSVCGYISIALEYDIGSLSNKGPRRGGSWMGDGGLAGQWGGAVLAESTRHTSLSALFPE